LLCVETLGRAGIAYRLLGASDIRRGGLDNFKILLVPGGWAAHKVRALRDGGKKKIAEFLDRGGTYIGFCGGAGMALSSPPALGLAPVERMALAERLPSASGRIIVSGPPAHPAWKEIPARIPVSVWWPSQFKWNVRSPGAGHVLATYSDPGDDFRVADLRVSDLDSNISWPDLERSYGINLDPDRIKGHPAIIETQRGRGRLILSYAHLETPGDYWGNRLLFNILEYLDERAEVFGMKAAEDLGALERRDVSDENAWKSIHRAREAAADLIAFGEANLLWNWRTPWLLNWRRGIRGLEYGTLFVTLDYMCQVNDKQPGIAAIGKEWLERAKRLEADTVQFQALAKRLLLEEKIATQTGTVSKLGSVNERVDTLRVALFGNKMNHGGLCRALFDLIDSMLLDLLRSCEAGKIEGAMAASKPL